MARKSKKPELYKEAWKRTARDTIAERDLGYGRLIDYAHGRKVELRWGYNPEMVQDSLVSLKVAGTEVIIDVEELMKYIRWV